MAANIMTVEELERNRDYATRRAVENPGNPELHCRWLAVAAGWEAALQTAELKALLQKKFGL